MRLMIIGIGQTLRNDDGAGLAAVRHWQEKYPERSKNPSINIEQAELPGVNLLYLMEDVDAAILVDAVQSGSPPGTIHKLNESDLEGFTAGSHTAHGWGVAETLKLGRKLKYKIPGIIHIIGIEGENFFPGNTISPSIIENLAIIAQAIEDSATIILEQWSK